MKIERYPDGTYVIKIKKEEIRNIERKIERGEELDDEEIETARTIGLC